MSKLLQRTDGTAQGTASTDGRRWSILEFMHATVRTLLVLSLTALTLFGAQAGTTAPASGPRYASDGRLAFPSDYRRWVYLSSGFDMSYRPGPATDDHHMFDNVFADPQSYAVFEKTGHWPDKTMLVLESRAAQNRGSINLRGHFQRETMGIEVHVRDASRFAGGWAFFAFDTSGEPGALLPPATACYACHSAHAAVDTTFVQFYPTLFPIAEKRGTLRAPYLAASRR